MRRILSTTLSGIRAVRAAVPAVMLFSLPPLLFAQNAPHPHETVVRVRDRHSDLRVTEKFAKIVELSTRIVRVDGHDPEVLRVTAVTPHQIRVLGLKGGVTNLVLVDEQDRVYEIQVLVVRDARHVQAIIDRLFPHASVTAVKLNSEAIVLRGWVTRQEEIEQIMEIAEEFSPNVKNQMKVGGVQQVLLKCKIMEVQRSKVRRLGMNFLYTSNSGYLTSTPGPITPIELLTVGTPTSITVAGLADTSATFGLINNSNIFQGFLQALKTEGLLKIHAEPSLVTMNGHPAELINGGQFPVVVPAGLGTVAIEWRDFGVILRAVPIILGGGRVRLEVEPEVSERDFSSGVVVEGTTVPGLSVRRTRTQVEMNFGETLIIAGLISWRKVGETQKLPFFGDLPWIGAAFGIKNFNSTETELVVMLTPEYVAPLRPDQVPNGGPGAFTDDPTSHELYFHNLLEVPKWGDDCLGCQHGVFPGTMMPMGNCNCCDRDSASQPGLIAPNRQQPATVHSGQPRNPYQIQEPRSTAPPSTPGTPGAPEAHYAIPQPLPPARPPAPEPNGPPGLIAPGGP